MIRQVRLTSRTDFAALDWVRRLWTAVVRQAVRDYVDGHISQRDVYAWCNDPTSTAVLCAAVLGIDTDALARLITAMPRRRECSPKRSRGRDWRAQAVVTDRGEYYDSITDAACALGVARRSLSRAIKLGRVLAGRRWQYARPTMPRDPLR